MIKPRRYITVRDGIPIVSDRKSMDNAVALETGETIPAKVCKYRGEQVGSGECELCGSRGKQEPIYKCEKHGKCCQRQYKKLASQQTEQICIGCPDGPWSA